jgi:hypothetical protein
MAQKNLTLPATHNFSVLICWCPSWNTPTTCQKNDAICTHAIHILELFLPEAFNKRKFITSYFREEKYYLDSVYREGMDTIKCYLPYTVYDTTIKLL